MSLPNASDARPRGASENRSIQNTTALLYADGKALPAAIRPPVTRRSACASVDEKPRQKLAFIDQHKIPDSQRTGTMVLDRDSSNLQVRELSFEEFEIGVPPVPLDSVDVESLRKSICLVGQTTPVLVREFPDGRLALLDGWGRVEALRLIGHATISAIILLGLSDQEARLKQIVSNHRKKLSALDRACEDYEFLQIVRQRVSQGATPVGGRQPADKCHTKAAEELKVAPDRMARSERIARILPEAQAKIREFKLHVNQSALLKIADAGDTVALQIAKAVELYERSQRRRQSKTPKSPSSENVPAAPVVAADANNASEMPGIPMFPSRGQEVEYDEIEQEWRKCRLRELLLAVTPAYRERFDTEHLRPIIAPPSDKACSVKETPA